MTTKILVSACLLGENCKYNGGNNLNENIKVLSDNYEIIPICPEVFGGLSIPRKTSEILKDKVIHFDGTDVTDNFLKGAKKSLLIAKKENCSFAILKSKSPSCGFGKIYDGTFTNTIIDGNGVTADLLFKNGIVILNENNFQDYLNSIKNKTKM